MIASLSLAILMLVLSGLFSGSEIAFISANKLRIELMSIQGNRKGRILSGFVKDTSRLITTILIGNNIALVVYSIYVAKVMEPWLVAIPFVGPEDYVIILVFQTVLSTIFVLFFGEYLPKAFARINPDKALAAATEFLNLFYIIFGPIVKLVNSLSHFLLEKVFRLELKDEEISFSRKDLDNYFKETIASSDSPTTPEIDAEMFSNALEFNTIKARDCMIPRTEIVAMQIDEGLDALMEKFIETELSKIIIYRESIDKVLGYVHSSSMYKKPNSIYQVLQPVLVVPETMPGNMLLTEFTNNRKSIAIVVDEFGGTEGLLTMEDLVEEVFGEIDDEHDEPVEEEKVANQLEDGSWLFSARLEVDEINKEYDLDLPDGEYSTLAGLVMFVAETIPNINDVVEVGKYRITVMDASENMIKMLRVETVD